MDLPVGRVIVSYERVSARVVQPLAPGHSGDGVAAVFGPVNGWVNTAAFALVYGHVAPTVRCPSSQRHRQRPVLDSVRRSRRSLVDVASVLVVPTGAGLFSFPIGPRAAWDGTVEPRLRKHPKVGSTDDESIGSYTVYWVF